jgi:hypothetical protein
VLNPLSLARRIVGLGATGAIALVGAKSWLDEGRAQLRLDYYQSLADFYADATQSACLSREAVVDAAMARNWDVREVTSCGGAESYLRLVPTAQTPWMQGPDGFVMGFDSRGCRAAIPPECGN